MARDHAQVRLEIWNDDDFRNLSGPAQLLYLQLLTSATLDYSGVADWRPKRLAPLTKGRSAADVEEAGRELVAGLFIVIDDDTEEVLVRSFLRHDGLLMKPNMAKAMVKAFSGIASPVLRGVIVHQLGKLVERFPEWKGFGVAEVRELIDREPINPSDLVRETVPKQISNLSVDGSDFTPSLLTPSPAPNSMLHTPPISSKPDLSIEFEKWWKNYPRKEAKEDAKKAFKAAREKASFETLEAGLAQYNLAKAGLEKRHLKLAGGWLRAGRWADEFVPEADETASPPGWDALMQTPSTPRAQATYCAHHIPSWETCDKCRSEGTNF